MIYFNYSNYSSYSIASTVITVIKVYHSNYTTIALLFWNICSAIWCNTKGNKSIQGTNTKV